MPDVVYTIGHSTHSIDRLIELLSMHAITAVADVRSSPFSRFKPHFNRVSLQTSLKKAGIRYVFLGRELGGRPADRACYVGGTVNYDLVARTELFQAGISRVAEGVRRHRIALLCTEEDPLACHRALLVSRHLVDRGIVAQHIRGSGRLESHDEALARLMENLNLLDQTDLLRGHDALIVEAYHRQALVVAYTDRALADKELPREVGR